MEPDCRSQILFVRWPNTPNHGGRQELTLPFLFFAVGYTIEETNGSGLGQTLVRRMLANEAEVTKDYVSVTFVYGEVGGMWLQTATEASANVRILGRTTMVSRDVKYKITELVATVSSVETNSLELLPPRPFRAGVLSRPAKLFIRKGEPTWNWTRPCGLQ
jgi:hypothetical protein